MTVRAAARRLVQLARAALESSVRKQPPPSAPRDLEIDAFGVFVTIHHRGELRGCLGSLDCSASVVSTLVRLAAAVARDDYRFEPLREEELADTTIEVSLLTPPEPLTAVDAIEIGRHGLIVERGRHRGLLLPQVAPEHGWDRETFLAHTCLKAGLPAGAWRETGTVVLAFEAAVVGEDGSVSEASHSEASQSDA